MPVALIKVTILRVVLGSFSRLIGITHVVIEYFFE
jgi:hypothetical protein